MAPRKPTLEIDITGAMSIRHLAMLPNGDGYISAAHGDEEPFTAKVFKNFYCGQGGVGTQCSRSWRIDSNRCDR